jgi:hypothetical protein
MLYQLDKYPSAASRWGRNRRLILELISKPDFSGSEVRTTVAASGSVGSGSAGFIRFTENLKHVCSLEADIAQETTVRRTMFRASLVQDEARPANNLAAVFAYHRARVVG